LRTTPEGSADRGFFVSGLDNEDRQMSATREWWEDFFQGPWGELQAEGYPEERTTAETEFMVSALRLGHGDRVLDVACGIGRHSITLAERGLDVTGLDFNASALAMARRNAAERGVSVNFVESDMRTIEFEREFDAAICYFSSFGYFENEADDLAVARRIAAALKPGGRFLLELMTLETLAPIWQPLRWHWVDQEKTRRVLEETWLDFSTGRVEADWTFIGPEQTRSAHSSLRLYCYRELSDLLRRAGFRTIAGFDPATGDPFALGARRLALVASR
jgi:SAM-dependent methyltransferase